MTVIERTNESSEGVYESEGVCEKSTKLDFEIRKTQEISYSVLRMSIRGRDHKRAYEGHRKPGRVYIERPSPRYHTENVKQNQRLEKEELGCRSITQPKEEHMNKKERITHA